MVVTPLTEASSMSIGVRHRCGVLLGVVFDLSRGSETNARLFDSIITSTAAETSFRPIP